MKKVHFIGVAGVAIAPLAKMMKDIGWTVTGSDENVFEPMLSFLNHSGVEWFTGYDAERVKDADLVIIGGSVLMKDEQNPEYLAAKELGKNLQGYGYLINQYIAKENSVVVTGTYGKTTTGAILAWIWEVAGRNPSFMSGGVPLNFDAGVRRTDSEYSVLEGDEYVATWGFDMEPRFVHYKPKYAIVTAAQWDHLNVYPTEESYIDAFRKLLRKVEENKGFVLLSASGTNNEKLQKEFNGEVFTYMVEENNQITEGNVNYLGKITNFGEEFVTFEVYKNGELFGEFETPLIGVHNVENCVAAVGMSDLCGIDLDKIQEGMKTFKNVKRRQEIRGTTENGAIVIDDLAHSPVKAQATIEALRTRFKNNKMIIVFDPHASSLSDRKTLEWYPGVFDKSSEVILPKVTVKKSTPKDQRVYGKDVVEAIAKTQPNVKYLPIDEEIVKYLKQNTAQGDVIVFMSSGGWRGMIEALIG